MYFQNLSRKQLLDTSRIDLVVLDVMMPNVDGWELCREVREHGSVPILMLTAKGETGQKVKGLRLGADDYMVKPFEPEELIARVHALLRRYQIATEQVIQIDALLLDGQSRVPVQWYVRLNPTKGIRLVVQACRLSRSDIIARSAH